MIYITGDTHGYFKDIKLFCDTHKTSKEDILIILGDAGINYSQDAYDDFKKQYIDNLPLTIFAIHGNHEMRPHHLPSYKIKTWHQGKVYYEEAHPHILFGIDGEVYDFNGYKTLVIGGAYSVDKHRRLAFGDPWFEDEQPTTEIKSQVEAVLLENGHNMDVVLSHTCPLKYLPYEVFLSGINQSKVDQSTETWLDEIETKLDYRYWYCGHFHTDKVIDRIQFMFNDIDLFMKKG